MVFIYILELEHSKYYIGKSNNLENRILDHFSSLGAEWTRLHKPIKVIETISGDDFDEDKYTLKMMEKHGIDNVRGGSFCQIILSLCDIDTITRMLRGASNKCYKCGQTGHFINSCPSKDDLDPDLQDFVKVDNDELEYINICYRCGREGHTVLECYARKHINGGPPRIGVCYRCGSDKHWKITCKQTHNIYGYEIEEPIFTSQELASKCSIQ